MDARHDELEDLLGAYALDAVDDRERAAVEAHIAECGRCRAEVDAHREVAAHLAQTGAPAPDELWDRIADAIAGETPPPLRLIVDPDPAPASAPAHTAAGAGRSRPWHRGPMLAAAAVVVAVALFGAGFVLRGDDVDSTGNELATAALAAFESPRARTADLLDPAGQPRARVAVLPDGSGYVLAGALPDLDDTIYQLWGSDGETVVSLGPIGEAPDIVAFHAEPDQTTLMITEETEPVPRTSNPAVVIGELA